MARDAGLKRLREKYHSAPRCKKPPVIDEESWTMFTAYVYEGRSLRELRERRHLPFSRLRQVLCEVDAQLKGPRCADGITPQCPIEDLTLSIRARNTLHRLGCGTVSEVLELDLALPVLRIGNKTRMEVLMALQSAGFRHPALARGSLPGVASLVRSLERMQARVDVALRSVAKEVHLMQRRLEHWLKD